MARYFDVHPDNPQPRAIAAVVDVLRDGGLIAYPTDSCFALGCRLDNRSGLERIRTIRQLDGHHHFTLVCGDFTQLGQFAQMDNTVFRAVRAAMPGQYTFILPGHPRGAAADAAPAPAHRRGADPASIPVALAIIAELGEPLVSSTLLLPGEDSPMTEGWEIKETS